MKKRTAWIVTLLTVGGLAQTDTSQQLRIRIVTEKEAYVLNDKVTVKAEFTNATPRTLCFPPPDQDCEAPSLGWLVTTGESVSKGEGEQFLCHLDGGGKRGRELKAAIKNGWIKLAPGETYVAKRTTAKVTLDAIGQWRLIASYHPPEGSFGTAYRKLLQSAALKAGCTLPDSVAVAEPKVITVTNQ